MYRITIWWWHKFDIKHYKRKVLARLHQIHSAIDCLIYHDLRLQVYYWLYTWRCRNVSDCKLECRRRNEICSIWPRRLYTYVCMCACLPPRLSITSGIMCLDMDLIWLVKQALQLLHGSIISRCGFTIEVYQRNQPNKSKLLLYKLWIILTVV